jgi:hypothetical protein
MQCPAATLTDRRDGFREGSDTIVRDLVGSESKAG